MGAARTITPIEGKQPFKATALDYFNCGWLPMPLPARKKNEPPTGYTGWKATKKVTRTQVKKWISERPPGSNICHAPTEDYIGVDIDLYKGAAAQQWAEIIDDIGELPDTWTSSARADGSGIKHYRLPEGYTSMAWPGTVGDAIQFCHTGHRYPVIPPSRHPKDNEDGSPAYYLWYRPGQEVDGHGLVNEFPAYDELPILPVDIIDYFTKGRFAHLLPEKNLGPKSKATKVVAQWIAEQDATPCAKMLRVADEITEAFDGAAAHDTMRSGFYRLACLAAEGHSGLATVVSGLHEDFAGEVRREGRAGTVRGNAEAEEEWLRARDAGVKKVMTRIDSGDFVGHECTCGGLDSAGKPKPQFNVANYDLPAAMSVCYRALAASKLTDWHGAYCRGGEVVLRTQYGLVEANTDSMRSALARVSEWLAPGGDGPPLRKNPPRDILASLLMDPELRTLPPLKEITRSPFWALVDGKPQLVHENGYHAGSQVILDMDPELADAVHNVDGAEFAFGTKKLAYMLHEFPFEGPEDKANVYAALLLPYVRELITGPTPLHLIHAPGPGSGKTMLANTISKVIGGLDMAGRFAVTLPAGRNADEEIRKTILSALRTSPRVFIWDNVVGEVRSKEIAQALTETTYGGRLLGESRTGEYANTCLWMATGNQFRAIEDIRRRIIPIKLKAHAARRAPFDMDAFLEQDRKYIVWALLSMVQKWVTEGAPLGRSVTLPSYERYAEVIGGILEVNGVTGFMGNLGGFAEASMVDVDEYPELIEEWAAKHSSLGLGQWYRVGDILNALTSVTEWVDSSKPGGSRALGAILNGLKDRPIGENRAYVLQAKRPGNVVHYSLSLRAKVKVVRRGGNRR